MLSFTPVDEAIIKDLFREFRAIKTTMNCCTKYRMRGEIGGNQECWFVSILLI
jgi:hypothetical protein